MARCVAPQTRKYWLELFSSRKDDDIVNYFTTANHGFNEHRKKSARHHHDWVIFRACAVRELRKRGLPIPDLRT